MKATILAAGMGKRLRPITDHTPKCLIEFNGKSLIDNYFNSFYECGIREAVLVVGYLSETIERKLGDRHLGIRVKYVHNKDYAFSNSAYSLWLAKDEISEGSFILTDSDILFDGRILQRLLNSKYENCLVVDPVFEKTGEEVKVVGEANIVKHLGKGIPDRSKVVGESLGLYRFSEKVTGLLFEGIEKYLNIHGRTAEYEDALDSVLSYFKMHYVMTRGLQWIDIDSPEDLQKANKLATSLMTSGERLVA